MSGFNESEEAVLRGLKCKFEYFQGRANELQMQIHRLKAEYVLKKRFEKNGGKN